MGYKVWRVCLCMLYKAHILRKTQKIAQSFYKLNKIDRKHQIYRKICTKNLYVQTHRNGGKHRFYLHKAQKYGIISTEKRNI